MSTRLETPNRRVAFITGVGRQRGIGAGVARALALRGWDLALTYWAAYDRRMPWGRASDETANLVGELRKHGVRVTSMEADLESPSTASQLFREALEQLGPITALVLSHCESVASGILDTSPESFDRHFAVNTRASWQLIREFALQIPLSGGKIIGLTSDHTVGNLPYGASKGALDRIALAAARELAHLGITAQWSILVRLIQVGWTRRLGPSYFVVSPGRVWALHKVLPMSLLYCSLRKALGSMGSSSERTAAALHSRATNPPGTK